MNFSFTSKLKVENKIRKKTCYIYCCIINNAPSEQILAGFLICHLQVSRYIFYSYSPTWLQPSKLKSRQVFRTSLQNTQDDLHKKSKAFIRRCTALLFSPLYLHLSLLICEAAVLQDWSIKTGSTSIFPPSVFKQKGLGQKKPLCGLWLTTRNHYEVFLPQGRESKNKNSPWFMACFQSLRRVATQTQQRVLGLRQHVLQG